MYFIYILLMQFPFSRLAGSRARLARWEIHSSARLPFGCLLLKKELGPSLPPASRTLRPPRRYVGESAFPSVVLFGALLTSPEKLSMHLDRKRGNMTL